MSTVIPTVRATRVSTIQSTVAAYVRIPFDLYRDGELGTFNDIRTYETSYFTDAGTTPATIGDAIYQINGQSGNGVNWTQGTATARPVLSARYNRAVTTELFSSWVSERIQPLTETTTAPDGESLAYKWVPTVDSGVHRKYLASVSGFVSGDTVKFSFYAKESGYSNLRLQSGGAAAGGTSVCDFNLLSGTVSATTGAFSSASMTLVSGFYLCTVSMTLAATAGVEFILIPLTSGSGDGTSGIYIWGADLRLASDTDQPAYQRVGDLGADPGDYDTEGFDKYLVFDLGDDALSCTLAAGTYTVVLPTREGIFFDSVIHAGGTFTIGPTSYTGGPDGILTALATGGECRLIGPPMTVNRALTAAEQSADAQWYQNRGAGPELELGPELVTNGTFDADVSGWATLGSASISWVASEIEVDITGSLGGIYQSISGVNSGSLYVVGFYARGGTFSGSLRVQNGSASVISESYPVYAGGTVNRFAYALPIETFSLWINRATSNTGTVYLDNISVRKLQPKGS